MIKHKRNIYGEMNKTISLYGREMVSLPMILYWELCN